MSVNPNAGRALTTDLIAAPAMHRLILMVAPESLDVVITSRVSDADIIYRHIDFAPGADTVAALEESVYDNPLLTADFHRTDIIVDNNRFFVMAAADADADEMRRRIDLLWPRERTGLDLQALTNDIESGRTVMVWAPERRLTAFLRRTWHNPAIVHRVAVLARYYALKNHLGNMGKIHACLSGKRLDLMVFGREGLLSANSFATPAPVDDATFYILAAAAHYGFESESDRVLVSGDRTLRDELVASVRRFIALTMPEIYPSALNALTLNTPDVPFEALILPYTD